LKENQPGRDTPATKVDGARPLRSVTVLCILVLLLEILFLFAAPSAKAQVSTSAGVLLQAGIEKEEIYGDLKSAMEIYQKVFSDTSASRDIRSTALLRIGGCDEKLRRPAKQVYEQIVRDYGDQPAAVQARKRIILLSPPDPAVRLTTIDRKIEWSRLGQMGPADTDGERAVYASGDTLYSGDLAGRSRRQVLNTKRFDWVPCRDFKLVLLDLLSTPIRQHTLGVIKPDGTGFRALIRDDAKNSIFQRDQSFAMSCSWDDRNVLLSNFSLKSAIQGQLWLVSVADGEHRVLVDVKDSWIKKAVFSPDGRFAAYEVWPKDAAPPHTSRVFVVPVAGGEPHLVYTSAPWQVGNAFLSLMDWSANGRNLIVRDVQKDKSALYLLPMKDAVSTGTASFVRFGDFDDGYTTMSGALVYEDKSASPSNVDVSLASIDPEDRIGDWRPIDLNTNGASNSWPSFSPDGLQIAYVAKDADPARRDVIVRDLATGQERELYRSLYGSVACQFSPRNPKLYCTQEKEKGETELISVAVDSGAVEKITTLAGSRFLLSVSRDDQAFFFSGNAWLLGTYEPPILRWDRTTQQESTIEPASEDQRLISVSPDGRLIVRLLDGVISIRPINSGNWKVLASGVPVILPPLVMSDGKWVLYEMVDSTGRPALFRVSTTGGNSERLGDLPNNGGAFFFSPDGHQVLAIAEKRVDHSLSVLENFVPAVKKEHEP
jgi:Tol biopolymer transport system component